LLNAETFSYELREKLKIKYRRLPSAAFVANQFNRHNEREKGISQESARRWLRGESMPNHQNLQVLGLWLGLKVEISFVKSVSNNFSAEADGPLYSPQILLIAELISKAAPQMRAQIWDLIRVCPIA
jgi:transcriptional regulator with XRE-family HTH domain